MTRAMRLVTPGLDGLECASVPAAAPGPHEITVRIGGNSINYHDYFVVKGFAPVAPGRIPLSDGAGEVIAVGDAVTEFAVGDQVISLFFPDWQDGGATIGDMRGVPGDGIDGFARDEVTMPASAFTRAPAGWSAVESATLACAGLTAWRGLMEGNPLRAGDTVLVQGTGGVSIFALQFAKAASARVIATSSSDEKLARLTAMGADAVINYRATPDWGMAVRDLTEGRGADVVVEIGGSGTLPQSIAACRVGGRIALIGILAGVSGSVSMVDLINRQIHLEGLMVGSRRQQQDMVRAVEATGLRPVIDRSFPLEALGDAFRYQETGGHFGKICIAL